MRIGELAQRAGATTKAIRYYESLGLLPEPDRTTSGYRDYRPDAIERVRFIKDAQASGLTLTEIQSLVELKSAGQATCAHTIDLLRRHLADIATRSPSSKLRVRASPRSPNGQSRSTTQTAPTRTAATSSQPTSATRRSRRR